MARIASLEHGLSFLDISYAEFVTDEGLSHFKGKNLPITKLFVNGLIGISSVGLGDLISACQENLKVLEASLMG